MKRCVNVYMINDGINGRMPHAFETASDGSNLPDETYVEYEIRMYYHEGVLPARYPVPVTLEVTYTFEVRLILNLFKELWKEWANA